MDLAGVGDMLYGKGIKLFMTNILDTEPLSLQCVQVQV